MDVREQRVRFVVEATQKGSSFGALCEAYEISRPTGYLWLQRYRERGVAGIAECSRRPHHSPRRTHSDLERKVTELRLRYPDWGARKLQVLLAREGVQLPRNTIHRILRRHDLIGEQERGAAAVQRFERSRPNELWQMDFKGPKGWPQPMGPLSVLDDHSRYLIALAATGGTHGGPVQQQLEEAFQRCGVPEAMLMDHGTPWWSTHAQFGRTQLSLWLMRQGIRLCWSGIRHPQTPVSYTHLDVYKRQDLGRTDDAKKLLLQVLDTERRVLGPNQPETAVTKYDLATLLARDGRTAEALSLLLSLIHI